MSKLIRSLILLSICGIVPQLSIAQSVQWTQLPGPSGGVAALFTELPDGSILASSDRLYRTTDKGLHWTAYSPFFSGNGWIGGMSVAVNSHGDVYANGNPGIYVTRNNGHNWEHLAETAFGYSTGIYLTIDKNDNIFVFGNDSLYESTNDGHTWTTLCKPPKPVRNIIFSAASGSLFLATYDGILRTTNAGLTWDSLFIGTDANQVIEGLDGDGSDLFASVRGTVYHSTDDGNTWSTANNGLPTYKSVIRFKVNHSGLMISGFGASVYRSTDRGASWSEACPPLDTAGGSSAIALMPIDDSSFLFSTYTDIRGSEDGGSSLTSRHVGMLNTSVESVTTSPSGEIFVYAYPVGLLASTDVGNTWQGVGANLDTIHRFYTTVRVGRSGEILLGGNPAVVSTDHGATWTNLNPGITGAYQIMVTPANDGSVYAFTYETLNSSHILRTTDYGTTWTDITGTLSTRAIRHFAVDSTGTLYVALDPSFEIVGNSAYANPDATIAVSTDHGATWTLNSDLMNFMYRNSTWNINQILDLQIGPSGEVLVTHPLGVSISTDKGATWMNSLQKFNANHIVANSKGHIFLSTEQDGILQSDDYGQSWRNISDGIPHQRNANLYIDKDDFLMAGIGGSGIFRTVEHTNSIGTPAAVLQTSESDGIRISGIFPSPAVDDATIGLSLGAPAECRLTITDLTGRTVLMADQQFPAGAALWPLKLHAIPAGVYNAIITSGSARVNRLVSVVH